MQKESVIDPMGNINKNALKKLTLQSVEKLVADGYDTGETLAMVQGVPLITADKVNLYPLQEVWIKRYFEKNPNPNDLGPGEDQ